MARKPSTAAAAPLGADDAATAALPSPPAPGRFELVPLSRLVESPANHRKKTWGAMDELVESVRAKGVLQPILVRPVKGIGENMLEIVFGHRRFRAAQEACLEAIPAVVRELTDVEALEANVIENLQRADVHPLEEAEGYEQLLEQKERPYTVDEIAAKVGKSKAYVYGRMKLLSLCAEARTAFYQGELSASVALLVARIPSAELQRKALERVGARNNEEPLGFREAAHTIHREFMLRLENAPFSPADAELVPAAGPCATCPKRSGSQPELFADVASADVCSDPTCFKEKVDAALARREAAAKKEGRKVLPAKQAERLFNDHEWEERPSIQYQARSEYADLDEPCYEDPKRRKWRELLGDHAAESVVLARDPKGNLRELVPVKQAPALLKKAGVELKKKGSSTKPNARKAAGDAKRELEEAINAELRSRVAAAAEKRADVEFMRVIASAFPDVDEGLCRRVGKKPVYLSEKERAKALAKLDEKQLRGLIAEAVLEDDLMRGAEEKSPILTWAGVDRAKVEAEVRARLEPTGAPSKRAAAKKGGRRG